MNIVFLGPPGSGKGTQSSRLAYALGIPHISTGDLIRDEIENKTELGLEIADTVKRGDLIDDEKLERVLEKRLSAHDCASGFILDGTPRDIEQTTLLEGFTDIDLAVLIDVPDEVVTDRISKRWVCPKDHHEYNSQFAPPKKEGVCDLCRSALTQRPDDTPEGVKHRLEVYHEQTEPVIRHYSGAGKLLRIDGDRPIDQVFNEVKARVQESQPERHTVA